MPEPKIPSLVSVRNLRKSFPVGEGTIDVLKGVSLSLERGSSLALTGESGSGKSTLLYLVAGLDGFDGGEIEIEGQPLSKSSDSERAKLRRDTLGIIFQQFNLVPSLTVDANLRLAARLADREDKAWISHLAHSLKLDDHLKFYPEQLSGGQQQRVAIGRALAPRPALVLADEPTGNLDEETASDVAELLAELVREAGAGLLTVTHSERLASAMDTRLNLRNGVIAT